ncbi:helix-turn-helix transcriptional regulator [Micromonospora wenchangensis]|uniref:helix-turn-helix transcriptional regulator n=1 Tax=Micromonospora wenchangensis TaxID=1185415 RepID=UPI0038004485
MLGEKIKNRRTELQLSVSAAARAAGINRNTWSAVERGERETEDYTFGAIERALRWRPGSITAMLHGRAPEQGRPAHPTPHLTDDQYAAAAALYKSIRDNPDRSRLLRDMAAASLEQLNAIRAADRAEGEAGTAAAS